MRYPCRSWCRSEDADVKNQVPEISDHVSGFGVLSFGFGVWDLGFGVWGLGVGGWDVRYKVQGWSVGCRVWDRRCTVRGVGCRV